MTTAMANPVELSPQASLALPWCSTASLVGRAMAPIPPHSRALLRYQQPMAEYGPDAAQELLGVAVPYNHIHFSSTSD